jgi:hypothetical protein
LRNDGFPNWRRFSLTKSLELGRSECFGVRGNWPARCGRSVSDRALEFPVKAVAPCEGTSYENTIIGVSYVMAFNLPPIEMTGTALILIVCAYGLVASCLRRSDARKKASDGLARVGLSNCGDRLPSELSGGQQQRFFSPRTNVTRREGHRRGAECMGRAGAARRVDAPGGDEEGCWSVESA